MGISRTATQLNTKLQQVPATLEQTRRAGLRPTARVVAKTMERTAGQSGLHRGDKIAGARWRGVYVRGDRRGLAVGYAAPAWLIDKPTKPHVIAARGLARGRTKRTRQAYVTRQVGRGVVAALINTGGIRSRRRSSVSFNGNAEGAQALSFGGDEFAAYAMHPGTQGKHFYRRAIPAAKREGAQEMGNVLHRGMAAIFR